MKWVLVVDDEPFATRLLKSRLEEAGYRVEVAADGAEALERLSRRHFDALVTDLMMPRMGGRELCEEVRKHSVNDEPFILVVTSRPESELREWTGEFPNLSFMEKPVSLRRLVAAIDQHLHAADGVEGDGA